jgi:hypothetical protein
MNDVSRATGFLAIFKRDIEPRMMELAELRTGKAKRIPVIDEPTTKKITVKYEDGEQDWEYESHTQGGKTWIAVF